MQDLWFVYTETPRIPLHYDERAKTARKVNKINIGYLDAQKCICHENGLTKDYEYFM